MRGIVMIRLNYVFIVVLTAAFLGCGGGGSSGGGGGNGSGGGVGDPRLDAAGGSSNGDLGGAGGDIAFVAVDGAIHLLNRGAPPLPGEFDGATSVTSGLIVPAGQTVAMTPAQLSGSFPGVSIAGTLRLTNGTSFDIVTSGDVLISGTVVADGTPVALGIRASGGTGDVRISGTVDLRGQGTNQGGTLRIGWSADGQTEGRFGSILVDGVIDCSGADGPTGGDAGAEVFLNALDWVIVNGHILVRGGNGTAGPGGDGGDILLETEQAVVVRGVHAIANGGGGSGANGEGGNAGEIDFLAHSTVRVESGYQVAANGGSATDAGRGGEGGDFTIEVNTGSPFSPGAAANVDISGEFLSVGGQSPEGTAGSGGRVTFDVGLSPGSGGLPDTVSVPGVIRTDGGATVSGTAGNGGAVVLRTDDDNTEITVSGTISTEAGLSDVGALGAGGRIFFGVGPVPQPGNGYTDVTPSAQTLTISGTVTSGRGHPDGGDANVVDFNVLNLDITASASVTARGGARSVPVVPGLLVMRPSSVLTQDVAAHVEDDNGDASNEADNTSDIDRVGAAP